MSLRRLIKSLARKAGYDIHPVARACLTAKDAFSDQKVLLTGTPVKTIFDIGANTGQTTIQYRMLFPEAVIYSFEPFAEPLHQLRRTFEADALVKPIQLAVSDRPGRKKFFLNQSCLTNSLLPSVDKTGLYENTATIEVPVTTIDDFCRRESIDGIQILKMDIQGGELLALQGATEKLKQQAITLIYTEILFTSLYEEQAFFFHAYDFLSGYGYELFDMYNYSYLETGQIAWGDAMFISPRTSSALNSKRTSGSVGSSTLR